VKPRVLVVDPHPVFRLGLVGLLQRGSEFEVVGEADRARTACLIARSARPDVVTLDTSLPGVSGLDAVVDLRRLAGRPRMLMLTGQSDEEHVARAIAEGASGYALKREAPEAITEAVRTVARRGTWFSPLVARIAARLSGRRRAAPRGPLDALSRRERVVYDLLVRGHTTAAVARELFISPRTVGTHRFNLFKKLGLHSIGDLVRFAARNGHAVE
jgi:DNA-binding NarL/FixJ family response regulator